MSTQIDTIDQTETGPFPCNEVIRQQLLKLREGGFSNNKLARKLGVSAGQVSLYLNVRGNQYRTPEKLEQRAEDLLRNEARRAASGVETIGSEVYRHLSNAVELGRRTSDVVLVTAPAGMGKSRGLELYAATNPTSLLYSVNVMNNDVRSVIGNMFRKVGRSGWDGSTNRSEFIVSRLVGGDRALLIDDGHKLTRPALQWFFDLHDATHMPVVIAGTPLLMEKIIDDSQRGSRVGLHFPLESKQPAGLLAHLVKSLVPDAGDETEAIMDLCEQIAAKDGHFRAVHKQLKLAGELRAKSGSYVEAIQRAHSLLVRAYKLN
jgi:DNA transposition AAA+ family ATPase